MVESSKYPLFSIKDMDLELLEKVYLKDQKDFHGQAFEEQVLQTLSEDGKFRDIAFDQVYSESLEFLDSLRQFL